jgi:hypothetical protein
MKEPRASTVIVSNIPRKYREDGKLREYLTKHVFKEETIKCVAVVKRTGRLRKLITQREASKHHERHARKHFQYGCFPRCVRAFLEIAHPPELSYDELQVQVDQERDLVLSQARGEDKTAHDVNTAYAFVTFDQPRFARFAVNLSLQFSRDNGEFRVNVPPDPNDVNWQGLQSTFCIRSHERVQSNTRKGLGYVLIASLWIFFGPLVTGITSAGTYASDSMRGHHMGHVRKVLATLLPSISLLIFTGFLPSILLLIIRTFHRQVSEARHQKRLFTYYFYFQVVFVLLVPAIGSSLILTVWHFLDRPYRIFFVLAQTLPACSHFYLNYIVMHWSTQVINMTRYWNCLKYLWHLRGHKDVDSACFAEPEDQDYYGIGSRSARWTIIALIGLFFSQLDPIISVVALINFSLAKVAYGYLIAFAEQEKPDSGGAVWVEQLWGLMNGLLIYVCMMTGVLFVRAGCLPAAIAGSTFGYLLFQRRKFRNITWEQLPFDEMPDHEAYLPKKEGSIAVLEEQRGDWKVIAPTGLLYRRKKKMHAIEYEERRAEHGTVVQGIDAGDGWVRIGVKFQVGASYVQHELEPDADDLHERTSVSRWKSVQRIQQVDSMSISHYMSLVQHVVSERFSHTLSGRSRGP